MVKLDELRFTKTHEWVRIEDGKARVGITDHAQKEITDVVFIELPKAGRKVKGGEACAIVESVKAAFDIYAPASGEVAAVNGSVTGDPAAVNRAPYGEGWLFELKLSDPKEFETLMTHPQYQDFLAKGAH